MGKGGMMGKYDMMCKGVWNIIQTKIFCVSSTAWLEVERILFSVLFLFFSILFYSFFFSKDHKHFTKYHIQRSHVEVTTIISYTFFLLSITWNKVLKVVFSFWLMRMECACIYISINFISLSNTNLSTVDFSIIFFFPS